MMQTPQVMSHVQRKFTSDDLQSWNTILTNHIKTRDEQIVDLFHKGVKILNINPNEEPNLDKINEILEPLTGFKGVFVDGLEGPQTFYRMLKDRQFPIGNFIRDKKDLSYTPEPDIVHDLYGHMPFFTDKKYADFCQRFGEEACKYLDREDLLRQFERFFWFTIEFGLMKTPDGNRVFGAGIASSTGECKYALSDEPEVLPFDIDTIRYQEFRIDQMQKKLFLLNSTEQLYSSLDELCRRVEKDK